MKKSFLLICVALAAAKAEDDTSPSTSELVRARSGRSKHYDHYVDAADVIFPSSANQYLKEHHGMLNTRSEPVAEGRRRRRRRLKVKRRRRVQNEEKNKIGERRAILNDKGNNYDDEETNYNRSKDNKEEETRGDEMLDNKAKIYERSYKSYRSKNVKNRSNVRNSNKNDKSDYSVYVSGRRSSFRPSTRRSDIRKRFRESELDSDSDGRRVVALKYPAHNDEKFPHFPSRDNIDNHVDTDNVGSDQHVQRGQHRHHPVQLDRDHGQRGSNKGYGQRGNNEDYRENYGNEDYLENDDDEVEEEIKNETYEKDGNNEDYINSKNEDYKDNSNDGYRNIKRRNNNYSRFKIGNFRPKNKNDYIFGNSDDNEQDDNEDTHDNAKNYYRDSGYDGIYYRKYHNNDDQNENYGKNVDNNDNESSNDYKEYYSKDEDYDTNKRFRGSERNRDEIKTQKENNDKNYKDLTMNNFATTENPTSFFTQKNFGHERKKEQNKDNKSGSNSFNSFSHVKIFDQRGKEDKTLEHKKNYDYDENVSSFTTHLPYNHELLGNLRHKKLHRNKPEYTKNAEYEENNEEDDDKYDKKENNEFDNIQNDEEQGYGPDKKNNQYSGQFFHEAIDNSQYNEKRLKTSVNYENSQNFRQNNNNKGEKDDKNGHNRDYRNTNFNIDREQEEEYINFNSKDYNEAKNRGQVIKLANNNDDNYNNYDDYESNNEYSNNNNNNEIYLSKGMRPKRPISEHFEQQTSPDSPEVLEKKAESDVSFDTDAFTPISNPINVQQYPRLANNPLLPPFRSGYAAPDLYGKFVRPRFRLRQQQARQVRHQLAHQVRQRLQPRLQLRRVVRPRGQPESLEQRRRMLEQELLRVQAQLRQKQQRQLQQQQQLQQRQRVLQGGLRPQVGLRQHGGLRHHGVRRHQGLPRVFRHWALPSENVEHLVEPQDDGDDLDQVQVQEGFEEE